jgi:hypothetical protein
MAALALWIATTIIYVTMAKEGEGSRIKIFSGYHFEDRPDILPYDSAIPLIFVTQVIKLPNNLQTHNKSSQCNNITDQNKFMCNLEENLLTIKNMLADQINLNFNDEYLPSVNTSRTRRGLVILQDFLSWCCNVASIKQVSNIYENQKDLETHTNEIIDSVNSEYQGLVNTSKSLNNFTYNVQNLTSKMHNSLRIIRDELNRVKGFQNSGLQELLFSLTQELWTYILLNYLQDSNAEVLEKCHINVLSEKIVKPINLNKNLNDLSKKALEKGLRLAIPRDNIHLYYKLKITSCKIINGTLVVRLNVPLINSETNGKMYKIIPTPVVWEKLLCNLDIEEYYIFKTENYSKLIRTTETTCNELTYPICLLPRMIITTSHQQCIHHILETGNIQLLQEHCRYTCFSRPNYPIITQLMPNKYLITNTIQELTLNCNNETKSTKINPIEAGTLELQVPCECSLTQDKLTLITKLKPCDASDITQIKSVVLLPATWSKLKGLKLFTLESGIHHEFDNLSEILDTNWTLNYPTFELANLKKIEHIKLKNNKFDIFNNTQLILYIIIGWTTILTLSILIIIYCLHIQFIKIKYMVPPKDYNTQQTSRQ